MESIVPLTLGQHGLLYLSQLNREVAASYNVVLTLKADAALETSRVQQAFDAVVARHPVLSARVADGPEGPRFVIEPDRRAPVRTVSGDLAEWASLEAMEPICTAAGPLYKACVISDPSPALLITVHHIVLDGLSIGVLLDELAQAYTQPPGTLPSGTASIEAARAGALDERAFLETAQGQALLQERAAQLKDLRPPTAWPAAHSQPATGMAAGAISLELSGNEVRQLRALVASAGASASSVYLAAFLVLIWQYTGTDEPAVALPLDRRAEGEDRSIGYLVNVAMLSAPVSAQQTANSLMEAVTDRQFEALQAARIPFPALIRAVKALGGQAGDTWMNLAFNYLAGGRMAWSFGEATLTTVPSSPAFAKGWLKLDVEDHGPAARCTLHFQRAVVGDGDAARLLNHYAFLLQAMAAAPERPLGDLPLLTPAEERRITVEWNDTAFPIDAGHGLHALFEAHAAARPDAVALRFEGQDLSYGALDRKADALAAVLHEAGQGPGRLVAVCLPRGFDRIVALLAVLKAGAAYVPIDPDYPAERVRYLLQDSRAEILLTSQDLAGLLPAGSHRVVMADSPAPATPSSAGRLPLSPPVPGDLAYCIYTSGSTGMPKGVAVSHRAVLNLLQDWKRRQDVRADDRCALWTSFGFDVSVWEWLLPLTSGASLAIPTEEVRRDTSAFLQWLSDEDVTMAYLPPQMARALRREQTQRLRMPRVILTGVEPIGERALAEALPDTRVLNAYGPTEATVYATVHDAALRALDRPIPIGRPIANVSAYVLNEAGRALPPGVPGELFIGGQGLAQGYLHRPGLTAERFVPDPFGTPGTRMYRTGDRARHLADGTLEFLGRLDDQLKVRGFRIEPGEIEAALLDCEGVKQALVTAQDFAEDDRRVAAYVVPHAGVTLKLQDIATALRKTLPAPMQPALWLQLDDLPRTAHGKVDRQALPPAQPLRQAHAADDGHPVSDTERWIAQIWCDVLGLKQVQGHDNFFALGGHSLLATQIVSRVGARTGKAVALRLLLEASDLRAFALKVDALQRAAVADEEGLPPIRRRQASI